MKYKKHIIYEEKECPVCGKMFSGLRECCSNKCYQHQYYLKNIETRKEYKRKYFLENREKIRQGTKKYYKENKELLKEKIKKYYEEHPEKLKKRLEKQRIRQKEFYKEHRDELLEKSRKWRKANPEKSREICRNQYWKNKEKGLTRIRVDGKLKWVERPKIYCITCGKEIDNVKNRGAKYCYECKKAIAREKYRNLSDEKKKELAKKVSINYHKRMVNMTEEQLEEHRRKEAERARRRYWKKKGIEI